MGSVPGGCGHPPPEVVGSVPERGGVNNRMLLHCLCAIITHEMTRDIEVFLFVDALGWAFTERYGFMTDVFPHRRGVDMQFGYSCSAIPTILSGTRPAENGHLSLFRYDPKASPFKFFSKFAWLFKPASFWNRGRVRNQLSKLVKKLYGFTGYFQLYRMPIEKLGLMDYCEKQDLFVKGGLGPVRNLADVAAEKGIVPGISNWRNGDAAAFAQAKRDLADGKRFLFVYTAEFDALMHDEVTNKDDTRVRAKLSWYQAQIGELLDALKATGRTYRLTLFSDHGMTPLTETADLMHAIESTGLVFGEDYAACYDSTLLRVNYLKPSARETIEKALAPFAEKGHWLSETEERAHGIWRADRAFGDAIFLMNPGIQIVPSDMGGKPLNGMHGFDPKDKWSQAAVLSTEPIPEFVKSVGDYFRMMTESMGGKA